MSFPIGEVISGTLRPQDLLEVFSSELRRVDEDGRFENLCREAEEVADHITSFEEDQVTLDNASEIISDLIDALNDCAPDYVYFGTHPGDGASFGWWPDIDAMEAAVREGSLLKVNDLSEIPPGHTGDVMLVNDHGNVTYYQPVIQFEEVWSCV